MGKKKKTIQSPYVQTVQEEPFSPSPNCIIWSSEQMLSENMLKCNKKYMEKNSHNISNIYHYLKAFT